MKVVTLKFFCVLLTKKEQKILVFTALNLSPKQPPMILSCLKLLTRKRKLHGLCKLQSYK